MMVRDHLHYVILLPPVERCVERVSVRPDHGFTDERATRRMHDEFARAEIALRHVVTNSRDDVDVVVAEVLTRFDSGELVYQP